MNISETHTQLFTLKRKSALPKYVLNVPNPLLDAESSLPLPSSTRFFLCKLTNAATAWISSISSSRTKICIYFSRPSLSNTLHFPAEQQVLPLSIKPSQLLCTCTGQLGTSTLWAVVRHSSAFVISETSPSAEENIPQMVRLTLCGTMVCLHPLYHNSRS